MAVRIHFIVCLLMVGFSLAITGTAAQAADQLQRYSFELHCSEPLLGSRWEQPGHEVYRMLDSLEEFRAAHPHQGVLDARLWKIWRDGDFQKGEYHHRAFCTVVAEDPALHQPVRDWILTLDGIQPDSIKPELCDPADPFSEWPPVEFIINGTSYSYPADFSPLERDWADALARTNYPNQTMFIVHPDERVTGRFGLGELSRAVTDGNGQPIVIETLQERFELGGIEIPAGMEFYPQFLPTHLVPEDEQELHAYLLGQLKNSIRNYTAEPMYGSVHWEQFDFPLAGNPVEQASLASAEFSGWLAAYPEFSSGKRFGECSLRVIRDATQQPVQVTLRLSHIGLAARHELLERFRGIGLEPSMRFGNNPPADGWFGDRQLIADHGFLLRNLDNRAIDQALVQQAVDSYMERRAAVLPALEGSSVEIDMKETGSTEVLRMKVAMPSAFELGQLKDWVSAEVPQIGNWQIDHDVWQRDDPAGPVVINGRSFTYPDDFAGMQTRRLASLFNYGVGQLVVGVFAGLDYSSAEDAVIPEEFRLGDVCLIERTAEGLVINTIEEHWDHGVDIEALNIPNGRQPDILANYPRWYGEGRSVILGFAREQLAGYEVLVYSEEQARPQISYRQIIANPIASTKLEGKFPGELTEILTEEEKQRTLTVTRQAYDALREWIADTEGYSEEDLTLGLAGMSKRHSVTFNANDQPDLVFQIQIGVAGATDEQLVELMDRICLATGMRDVWAMGNLFPSVLLDDAERVNAAANGVQVSTGSR